MNTGNYAIGSTFTLYGIANADTGALATGGVITYDSTYYYHTFGSNGTFTSATGFAADDIILDGDGFVTPTSSPAPEELVPGQLVDTLAIKVYDRPLNTNASIKVDNFISDGNTLDYTISQRPNSNSALIVKIIESSVLDIPNNNVLLSYSAK